MGIDRIPDLQKRPMWKRPGLHHPLDPEAEKERTWEASLEPDPETAAPHAGGLGAPGSGAINYMRYVNQQKD